MRDGNPGIAAGRQRSGDARNDFKRNTSLLKNSNFLSPASKNCRISTLQPHHALTRLGCLDHLLIDFILSPNPASSVPTQANQLDSVPHVLQD